MKKSIENGTAEKNKIELFEERKNLQEQKHIRKSSALYNFGQEVQLDAAFYIWFGESSSALHLAVDRATKQVLYGVFDVQETARAYYQVLINIVSKYGIPKNIKTDKRGCFSLNNSKYIKSELSTTQFGRICSTLGINLISSSEPTFKPNVERENKTFKGRLKAELHHNNITNIEEANKYLNDVFIPKMNSKFAYNVNPSKNDMKINPYTSDELNIIFSERFNRKIDNASSIKYNEDYYIPINVDSGEIVSYPSKTNCTVILAYDHSIWCNIDENLYLLHKLESREENSIETDKK